MNEKELRETVLGMLGDIAPEADLKALDPNEDLRDALDIDSLDFLAFAVKLHETLGVDVPESDYPKIRTLEACLGYLARAGAGEVAPPRTGKA